MYFCIILWNINFTFKIKYDFLYGFPFKSLHWQALLLKDMFTHIHSQQIVSDCFSSASMSIFKLTNCQTCFWYLSIKMSCLKLVSLLFFICIKFCVLIFDSNTESNHQCHQVPFLSGFLKNVVMIDRQLNLQPFTAVSCLSNSDHFIQ